MNTNFTKNPIVGTPLTPSVIRQIHTAVRRFMPIAGNGIRTSVTAGGTIISAIPAPAPKKQKDKPLPFEVRYDGTLDNGAGGWKIYLPTEHLVQFDGAYLDPLNGVAPILDANGDETGWYYFDEITLQDDHVWLVVTITDPESGSSSPTVDAEFAASEGRASTGEKVVNVCIAEVSYEEPEDEGGTPTVEIKQSVVGALVLTHFGKVPQPFDPTFAADATTGEIHITAIGTGYAPWGRRLLDVGSPASSSSVWTTARGRLGLKITHPTTYGATPTVEIIVAASSSSGTTASLPDSTDAISYLPLYDFDNGRITLDLRCYLALGVYE